MFQITFLSILLAFLRIASAAGPCTIRSGLKGECIATNECSKRGGRSEAGHCPGPANIQCCTTSRPPVKPVAGKLCVPPPVNPATVNLIKSFEGFVARPAPDPIGLPTVGYGHLCQTKGCGEVHFRFPLTQQTATQLLQQDLKVNSDILQFRSILMLCRGLSLVFTTA